MNPWTTGEIIAGIIGAFLFVFQCGIIIYLEVLWHKNWKMLDEESKQRYRQRLNRISFL